MTFYDSEFYGNGYAGQVSGMGAMGRLADVLKEAFEANPELFRDSKSCSVCKPAGKPMTVPDFYYHKFQVRESVMRKVIDAAIFEKHTEAYKNKLRAYIDKAEAAQTPKWFAFELWEI